MKLTESQKRTVALAAQGLTDKEVAAALGIAPRSAQHRMESVMNKLRASTRFQAGYLCAKNNDG